MGAGARVAGPQRRAEPRGDRYSGGVTASSSLGTRALSVSVAAKVHAETPVRWDGELDDRLAALARRYPDRLAVRTLDVVDNDSAA